MTTNSGDEYIHGTARDEQSRLAMLNRLLNQQSMLRLEPREGDRVLDVGCGFGLFANEIAERVGTAGAVVGIEREAAQIEEGKRLAAVHGLADRADIRQGDAYAFPLRDDGAPSTSRTHASCSSTSRGPRRWFVRWCARSGPAAA